VSKNIKLLFRDALIYKKTHFLNLMEKIIHGESSRFKKKHNGIYRLLKIIMEQTMTIKFFLLIVGRLQGKLYATIILKNWVRKWIMSNIIPLP
jgi:hypothetical protein